MLFNSDSVFGGRIPCSFKGTEALLNVLRVSHEFYDEAMVAFYSSSWFYFKNTLHRCREIKDAVWGCLPSSFQISHPVAKISIHLLRGCCSHSY